jgi:putative hemolysin
MNALVNPQQSTESSARLYVELASSEADIHASQRLRYAVFAQELGARLASAERGIDEDHFDAYCQHLLVRERDTGRIVATTRLMTDEAAARAGGFYSQGEFELDNVLALPGRRLEIGRTCVDPTHRQGAAIAVLWSGLAAFVNLHRVDYLFGCASIDLEDGGVRAHAIMDRLRQQAMAAPELRARPRLAVPEVPTYDPETVKAPLPPLLKAYIRAGAWVAGEPCYDPDFNVADVLVVVNVDTMDQGYARHFLQRTPRVDPR